MSLRSSSTRVSEDPESPPHTDAGDSVPGDTSAAGGESEVTSNTLCTLTADGLAKIVASCEFPQGTRVQLPPLGSAIADCPEGFIAVYTKSFTDGNLRLPVSRFICSVFEHFNMRLCQLGPFGVLRVICFEMQCRALGITPSVFLFNHFFAFYKNDNWYSFAARRGSVMHPADSCFIDVPTTCKNWKESFFWLGVENFPVHFPKGPLDPAKRSYSKNLPSTKQYSTADATLIHKNQVFCRTYCNSALVFCRVSVAYSTPDCEIICFKAKDKKKGALSRLELMLTKSCSKVRYERRKLPAGNSYVDPVLPLFVIPSPTFRSFKSDDLADPDAPHIRSAIGALPESSSSSDSLPLPVRSLKRKVTASSRRKKTSKKPLVEDVPSDTESDPADEEPISSRVKGKKPKVETSVSRKAVKKTTRKSVKDLSPKSVNLSKKTEAPIPDRDVSQSSVLPTAKTPVVLPTPAVLAQSSPTTLPVDVIDTVVNVSLPEVTPTPPVSPPRENVFISCETEPVMSDVPNVVLSSGDIVNVIETPLVTPPSPAAVTGSSSQTLSAPHATLSDDDTPFIMSTFVEEMTDISSPPRPVVEIADQEQPYVPGWRVRVSDDLNTSQICFDLVHHLAPPAVVNQLRGLEDPVIDDEVVQSLARSVAVSAEYMRRRGEREIFVQTLQRRVSELEKQVVVRTGEVSLLEGRLQRQKESKDILQKKYTSLLYENTADRSIISACTSEIEKLKKELEEKVSQPTLAAGLMVVDGKLLVEKDERIRVLEKQVADLGSARGTQLADWQVERSRLRDQLDLLGRTCEGLKADYSWIVEHGIKEFVHNLLSSSEFLVQRSRLCLLARNAGFAEGMREGHRLGRQKVPLSEAPNYAPTAVDVYDEASASDSTFEFPYLNALASNAHHPPEVLRGILPNNPPM